MGSYNSVIKLVCQNAGIASTVFLMASLIPWWGPHFLPACSIMLVLFQPQLWKDVVVCFTQPMLFAFVNVVILAIWMTSGSGTVAAASGSELDAGKEQHCLSNCLQPTALLSSDATLSHHDSQMISSCSPETPLSLINGDNHNGLLPSSNFCSMCTIIDHAASPDRFIPLFPLTAETKPEPSDLDCASDCEMTTKNRRVRGKLKAAGRSPVKPELNDELAKSSDKKPSVAFATSRTAPNSFSMTSPSVIVRDISKVDSTDAPDTTVCMREPMVIEEDELNERIEAFFAKFRENLKLQRQESLRRRQNQYSD